MTIQTKQCFKCQAIKPLEDFYKHPMMADGRVNKCKECNKRDVRENRVDKVEYYREYDRGRGNRQPKEYNGQYIKKYPVKYAAHILVSNYVRDGKLTRKPCEICGDEKRIHAHHDDYAYPLDVRWLCAAHHRQWHIANGEAKNAG